MHIPQRKVYYTCELFQAQLGSMVELKEREREVEKEREGRKRERE